jgi:hypothetical protein
LEGALASAIHTQLNWYITNGMIPINEQRLNPEIWVKQVKEDIARV